MKIRSALSSFLLFAVFCLVFSTTSWAQEACSRDLSAADQYAFCGVNQPATENFERVFGALLNVCASNSTDQLPLYEGSMRRYTQENYGVTLPPLTCEIVLEVAEKYAGLVVPTISDIGVPPEPPTPVEIWSAVVFKFREETGDNSCVFERRPTCYLPLPIVQPGMEIAAQEYSSRVEKNDIALQEFFLENNLQSNNSHTSGIPDLMLTIGSFVDNTKCNLAAGNKYDCSFTVPINCRITGMLVVNGVDFMGAALEARFCPQYRRGEGKGLFRKSNGSWTFEGRVLG